MSVGVSIFIGSVQIDKVQPISPIIFKILSKVERIFIKQLCIFKVAAAQLGHFAIGKRYRWNNFNHCSPAV